MDRFLTSLEGHTQGVLLLLLLVFAFMGVLNWAVNLVRREKYKRNIHSSQEQRLSYVIVSFFTKIIDDFRNLLALVIVTIFVALIFYCVNSTEDFELKMKAVQVVVASLGGLVGSIIGYYFGESAASKNQTVLTTTSGSSPSGGSLPPNSSQNPPPLSKPVLPPSDRIDPSPAPPGANPGQNDPSPVQDAELDTPPAG